MSFKTTEQFNNNFKGIKELIPDLKIKIKDIISVKKQLVSSVNSLFTSLKSGDDVMPDELRQKFDHISYTAKQYIEMLGFTNHYSKEDESYLSIINKILEKLDHHSPATTDVLDKLKDALTLSIDLTKTIDLVEQKGNEQVADALKGTQEQIRIANESINGFVDRAKAEMIKESMQQDNRNTYK